MTPAALPDPIDGDTDTPVRREALRLLGRTEDELNDWEHLMGTTDAYSWLGYCLDTWGLTPERVDPWLTQREYTAIRAHQLVSAAYQNLAKKYQHYLKPGG